MKIKWIEVPELRRGKGHGVDFYHNDLDTTQTQPVAFLEGYEWLHKGARTVTVYPAFCEVLKPEGVKDLVSIDEVPHCCSGRHPVPDCHACVQARLPPRRDHRNDIINCKRISDTIH